MVEESKVDSVKLAAPDSDKQTTEAKQWLLVYTDYGYGDVDIAKFQE